MEENAMTQKPRTFTNRFFDVRELSTSIVQGLVVTAGLVVVYWHGLSIGADLSTVTSLVFLALISANITLTLVNRSFYFSMATTIRYANRLIPLVIFVTIALVAAIFLMGPLREFFRFGVPRFFDILLAVALGFLSVIWFEGYKLVRRKVVSV